MPRRVVAWWWRGPGPLARLAAWAVVVAVFTGGLWRVESVVHQQSVDRHDRCVEGRRDIRSAIIGVVDRLGDPTPTERRQLVDVLEDELPASAC